MRRRSQTIVAETVQDYIEISNDLLTTPQEPPKKSSNKSSGNRKRFQSSLMDSIRFQSLPQNLTTILEDRGEEQDFDYDSDKENKLDSIELDLEHLEGEHSKEDYFKGLIRPEQIQKRVQDKLLILAHKISSPHSLFTQMFSGFELKFHNLQDDHIEASIVLDAEVDKECFVIIKTIKGDEEKQHLERLLNSNYYLFVYDNENCQSFKALEQTLRLVSDSEIFRKSFLVGHQANPKTIDSVMTEEALKLEEELKCKGSVFTGMPGEEFKWEMIKSTILNYYP